MQFNSGNDSDHKKLEPGPYTAVCYRIVDLGTQEDTYDGKTKKVGKLLVCWEVSELMDDGRPFSVCKEYTKSLGEKSNLFKDVLKWSGLKELTRAQKDHFSPMKFLGKSCLLVVGETRTGKAKVDSLVRLREGQEPLKAVNELTYLDLEAFDSETFAKLPDWIKAKVIRSPEYLALQAPAPAAPSGEASTAGDDIPF